jgi:hypothetical protein
MAFGPISAFREAIPSGDSSGGIPMRLFRPISAALATTVIAAGAFTGPAAAQAAGVGTSLTSTKVLTAQLGENAQLLDLLLLGDDARSTIDSAVAAPEAFSKLTALSVKTAIVPGNPINLTQGVAEARSDGANEVPIAAAPIAVPTVPAQLAPVLSGNVDAGKLTASLTNGVASSGLNTSLSDIKAVGGLISLASVKSSLDATSSGATSSALRGASVNDLTVLDLGALLQGLGLPLGELTPAQVIALVDGLAAQTGLPLPSGADTLAAAVAQLNAAIADLQATIATVPSTTSAITTAIDSTTTSLLGAVGGVTGVTLPLPSTTQVVSDAVVTVNALISQLQGLLNDLLAKGLTALDNLSLLRMEGVEVGVTTKAVDTVAGSVATVTGKVGKVSVGGLALPGIDLTAPLATVNANVANINTKLGEVLSLVDPSLANVVKVSLFDKATSVVAEGGYVRSRAGITAASATITPPANLAAVVKTITDQVGVAQTLVAANVPVPAVSGLMNDLAGSLNLASSALTSQSKVSIASVLSASDFRLAGTTSGAPGTSTPSLPRTGGGADLFLYGGLAAVLALAIRRFGRTPAMKAIRIDD